MSFSSVIIHFPPLILILVNKLSSVSQLIFVLGSAKSKKAFSLKSVIDDSAYLFLMLKVKISI